MAATAIIDPATTRVVDVSITNQGTNRRTRYQPEFSFVGGLNFSETLIEALVTDDDNNASISAVTFYVNGTQIENSDANNENPDRIPPYRILWSPDGPGFMNYMRQHKIVMETYTHHPLFAERHIYLVHLM